ncbi:MAG: hypothetical protein KDK75_14935 [Alphaproteobacteria bacterium]|nr:hypothetical protein [Alphaproteobacteria bacterium]
MNVPQINPPAPKAEALKPLLWLIGFSAPSGAASTFSDSNLAVWMVVLTGISVVAFLFAYFYLLFRHPDRLQSEDYMTRLLGDSYQGTKALDAPATAANTAAPVAARAGG